MKIVWKWMAILLLLALCYQIGYQSAWFVSTITDAAIEEPKMVVLLDPGHGGEDPGKVSAGGVYEKDINLSIAKKLKTLLEQNGVCVFLTREQDVSLGDKTQRGRKKADLQARIDCIKDIQPTITVSIHQNSFPKESVHGAQTFYYKESFESKQLAETVQKAMQELDSEQTRLAKSNEDYFLLKNSPGTIIIAECGFLSNVQEAARLCDDAYQNRVAFKLHLGILRYLKQRRK